MANLTSHCNRVIFWPQYGGTCWFNAILIAVFYSQFSRNMLYKISSKWDKRIEFYKILRFVLKHKYLKSKNPEKDFKFFDVMKPENILKMIHKIKNKYVLKGMWNGGSYFEIMITKLYKILGVDCLMLEKPPDDSLYYDKRNHVTLIPHATAKKSTTFNIKQKSHEFITRKLNKLKNPDVIIVNPTDYKAYEYKTTLKHYNVATQPNGPQTLNKTIVYNGTEYILDSILLANWNGKVIKKGHAVAGITCNDEHYVYNGWTRFTRDPTISSSHGNGTMRPCELMKYDWNPNIDNEFCILLSKCNLPQPDEKQKQKELCFSFAKGPRSFIYIKKENEQNTHDNYNTPEYRSFSDYKRYGSQIEEQCGLDKVRNPATNRCIKKDTAEKLNLVKPDCPEGKVRNPVTGRCINAKNLNKKDAKIAKKVVNLVKECPEGKVRNPVTGRCIKIK